MYHLTCGTERGQGADSDDDSGGHVMSVDFRSHDVATIDTVSTRRLASSVRVRRQSVRRQPRVARWHNNNSIFNDDDGRLKVCDHATGFFLIFIILILPARRARKVADNRVITIRTKRLRLKPTRRVLLLLL